MLGQIRTKKYVVHDGISKFLGYDSASGGYPYMSEVLWGAKIFNTPQDALEHVKDAIGEYGRAAYASVYQVILDEIDTAAELENLMEKKRQVELARIQENVKHLRPEDIEYIKANF